HVLDPRTGELSEVVGKEAGGGKGRLATAPGTKFDGAIPPADIGDNFEGAIPPAGIGDSHMGIPEVKPSAGGTEPTAKQQIVMTESELLTGGQYEMRPGGIYRDKITGAEYKVDQFLPDQQVRLRETRPGRVVSPDAVPPPSQIVIDGDALLTGGKFEMR